MQNFNVNAVLFVILDLLRKYRPKGYWPFLYTCKQWEYSVFTKEFKVCIFYSIYINKFHFMFIVKVYYLNAFNFDSQLIERKLFICKMKIFLSLVNISFFFYRVKGMLSNFGSFSKDFNCPVGAAMNPVDKCVMF